MLVDLGDCGNESLGVMSSSFSSGGATFIFPNTSVYPEATQRIATRPGMSNDHFLCAVILLLSSLEYLILLLLQLPFHKYEALF